MISYKTNKENAIFFIIILIFSISCSTSRIINKEDISKIQEGKTTKQEVVSALGLPNQRKVDEGNEYWVYFREGTYTGTTLPTAGSIRQAYKSGLPIYNFETSQGIGIPNLAAIIWFNQSGVVIKIIQGGDAK